MKLLTVWLIAGLLGTTLIVQECQKIRVKELPILLYFTAMGPSTLLVVGVTRLINNKHDFLNKVIWEKKEK